MKNVKKAIAFISALTLMGTVTACGSNDSGTSSTSAETSATTETTPAKELDEEDKAAVAEMDTGDDEKLENGTVKWLSFWDLNPANGKPKSVELELFETKYGGKIEYIPTTYETRYSDLSTQVLGGTSPDLFPAADLDTFPGKAIAGMFEPFDDYLDFDSDLWSSGAKSFQMSILWAASIMLPWFQQMQAAYVSTTRKLSVKTVCPTLPSSLPRATGTGILSRICAWNSPIPKTKSTVLTAGGLR